VRDVLPPRASGGIPRQYKLSCQPCQAERCHVTSLFNSGGLPMTMTGTMTGRMERQRCGSGRVPLLASGAACRHGPSPGHPSQAMSRRESVGAAANGSDARGLEVVLHGGTSHDGTEQLGSTAPNGGRLHRHAFLLPQVHGSAMERRGSVQGAPGRPQGWTACGAGRETSADANLQPSPWLGLPASRRLSLHS